MAFRILFVVTLLCLSSRTFAECTSSAFLKEQGISKLWAVPEVSNWRAYLYAHEGKKPVIRDEIGLVIFKGKCLFRFDAYSDEGGYLHRWHSLYIHPKQNFVYIDNADGEFLSLKKWRLTKDGKSWRTNNLAPKS
jgi:hypothetical protein